MMNNFAWAEKTLFWISGASQVHFSIFKGLHQCGYYFREHLYSQTSLKAWDNEEKQAFSSRLPLSRHIDNRSWHSYKFRCKRSSSIHNSSYWWVMIFWPGEDSPLKSGPLGVAAILFSSHPYMYPYIYPYSHPYIDSGIRDRAYTETREEYSCCTLCHWLFVEKDIEKTHLEHKIAAVETG